MSVRPTAPLALLLALLAFSGCKKPAQPTTPSSTATPPATPAARTTPDGLTITDLAIGSGEPCPSGATITMNFTARLSDGTIYDSSDKRKRSWTIPLSNPNVIAGLREGIPGMRVGGKRSLNIPYALAYGEQGREPVPPKTDLIFEIELLKWEPEAAGAAAMPD